MSSRDMCLLPRATLHSDSEHLLRQHRESGSQDPEQYVPFIPTLYQTRLYNGVKNSNIIIH